MTAEAQSVGSAPLSARTELPGWWPLAALTLLAAVLRLSTLDLQSFWYDEAFTPVHVLHASLSATLRAVSHTENSPPLWYLIEWVDYRLLGSGEFALRLPSALAGIAAVPVTWAIGEIVAGRRAAIASAALVAVNPLFVWYSQEARAYGLFVLTAALSILCFLRLRRRPDARRAAAFAVAGILALLSHYFAVFMLAAMAIWLLGEPRTRRACLPALLALALAGIALLPLISAQGGHGTQWIGRWPLSERLQAIPQYYLTGNSGAPLGHGVELLILLPILAVIALGLWRMTEPSAKSERWKQEAEARRSAAGAAGDLRRGSPPADRPGRPRGRLPGASQPCRRDDPRDGADRRSGDLAAQRRGRCPAPLPGGCGLPGDHNRRRPEPAPSERQLA